MRLLQPVSLQEGTAKLHVTTAGVVVEPPGLNVSVCPAPLEAHMVTWPEVRPAAWAIISLCLHPFTACTHVSVRARRHNPPSQFSTGCGLVWSVEGRLQPVHWRGQWMKPVDLWLGWENLINDPSVHPLDPLKWRQYSSSPFPHCWAELPQSNVPVSLNSTWQHQNSTSLVLKEPITVDSVVQWIRGCYLTPAANIVTPKITEKRHSHLTVWAGQLSEQKQRINDRITPTYTIKLPI